MDMIWALAGLAGLGGAGFIALLIFAPVAAAAVGQFLAAIIETRVGIAILALSAGLFAGDVYRAGHDRAAYAAKLAANDAAWRKKIDDAAAKFKVARTTRDADVDAVIDDVVNKATAAIDARASELQDKVNQYEKSGTHPGCVLTPDDLGGLSDGPHNRSAAKPRRSFHR